MKILSNCLLLLFMSCVQPVEWISAKEQNIIPGRPSESPYTNFFIELKIKEDSEIFLDSVYVYHEEKVFLMDFLIKRKGEAVYRDTIFDKGIYILEIPIKKPFVKKNIEKSNIDKLSKVRLFCREKKTKTEVLIKSFKKETITQR